jgi:hypothetical protein
MAWRNCTQYSLENCGPNKPCQFNGPINFHCSGRTLPAPTWSSTPPSEPGWYWWRFECYPEVVKPAELVQDRYGEKTWDFQYSIISDLTGREFWPIRMEKPPGSETRKDRE